MNVGARLGDAETRRRRHVRVAILAAVLLAVAAVLVFVLGDEDAPSASAGFQEAANATCGEFSDRIEREFELSFPEGVPSDEAVAEYLSHAFADTMEDLVAELRQLDGADAAAGAVDDLEARIAEVRAEPLPYATGERFVADGIAERFDDLGLTACGSEFLPS